METRLTHYKDSLVNISFCADEREPYGQNFYTVLIGENGSGKSRLLRSLVLSLTEGAKKEKLTLAKRIDDKIYKFEQSKGTLRVTNQGRKRLNKEYKNHLISFTASVTDKLPPKVETRFCEYTYLGPHLYHSSKHRTCNSLISFLDDLSGHSSETANRTLPIFDYIGFESKLSVHWMIKQTTLVNLKESYSQKRDFKRFVNESEHHSLYSSQELEELCDMYFSLLRWKKGKSNRLTVTIDFESDTQSFDARIGEYIVRSKLSKLGLLEQPKIGLHNKNGQEIPSFSLSSGESALVTSLLRLAPLVKQGSLIFLDEPELSLHPRWQTDYIHVLDKVIEGLGCHVFIATHSHLLISDLPMDNSEVLHLSNGGRTWERYTNTEGLSAEEILLDVFALPTSRNHYLNIKLQRLLDLVANRETDNKEFAELITQIDRVRQNLKPHDPLKSVIDAMAGEAVHG